LRVTAQIPGQGFIELPEAVPHVSSGVGKRVADPNAYCLREHRGRVGAYLKREHAEPVKSCAAVVYTLDAYVSDPDITVGERLRVTDSLAMHDAKPATHIVVAVLASSTDQSPHSPFRLIHNLAGGNKEAQVWDADEIRSRAKVSLDYDNEWATVADPV
jgi:hypothetical protein